MSTLPTIPFNKWDGEYAHHLTVAPDRSVYVVPSGAHERLHQMVVSNRDVIERFDEPGLRGTKVELALTGWVQLQSDQLTDRLNIDAPDGFNDQEIVRQFAQLHDAGSVTIAFYPSLDVITSHRPEELTLARDGERVPVSPDRTDRTNGSVEK